MTERLHDLLTREAAGLDVPAPPTGAVITRGKGVRRRRRVVAGAAALATAVTVGGGATFLLTDNGSSNAQVASEPGTDPVFSAGTTVFYGDGASTAEIDDKAVKSMFYTSAGVLVRHGDNPWSDGGGPQRFSLVTPDGEVRPLSLATEETVHVTDNDQPYVAYAQNRDGRLTVVVHDVEQDAVEASVDVGATKETWFPVSFDGSSVWVQDGYYGAAYRVDWREGVVEDSGVSGVDSVRGGHAVAGSTILDAVTGETVLEVEGRGDLELSTTGDYARLMAGRSFDVYDVEAGTHVTIEGAPYDWAWTADDTLFKVGKDEVIECDPGTGECETSSMDIPGLENVEGEQSTTTMWIPRCDRVGDERVQSGEVVTLQCGGTSLDCSDPEQRTPENCRKKTIVTDEAFPEELVLGGQIRES